MHSNCCIPINAITRLDLIPYQLSHVVDAIIDKPTTIDDLPAAIIEDDLDLNEYSNNSRKHTIISVYIITAAVANY